MVYRYTFRVSSSKRHKNKKDNGKFDWMFAFAIGSNSHGFIQLFPVILPLADSIPGVGGGNDEDTGESKEEQEEQERLRQEAIKQAELERRVKYKKQEDERESMRQIIRDKVDKCSQNNRAVPSQNPAHL